MSLAAGDEFVCAVVRGGVVRCWGANDRGQLGDGSFRNRGRPHPVPGVVDANAVVAAADYACAVLDSGRVTCWGEHPGNRGDAWSRPAASPTPVAGIRDAIELAAGSEFACARLRNGSVQCWGEGRDGQLGNGKVDAQTTPVTVTGIGPADQISVGARHACARATDGTVHCWGSNRRGQLGVEAPLSGCDGSCSPTPIAFAVATAAEIRAGRDRTCARTDDGAVACAGRRRCDRRNAKPGLHRLALSDAVALPDASCAVVEGGTLECFDSRAVADGGVCAPVAIVRPTQGETVDLALGKGFACRSTSRGEILCWGRNGAGALGDDTRQTRWDEAPVEALLTDPVEDERLPLDRVHAALASQPLSDHALMWLNATVVAVPTSPTFAKTIGQLQSTVDEQRGDSFRERAVVRVLESRGSFVRVETVSITGQRSHCWRAGIPYADKYVLRMWVRRVDLAPVIGREVSVGFADGSGVTVGVGVPLVFRDGVEVSVLGERLDLGLSDEDISLSYDRAGLEEPRERLPWQVLDYRSEFRLDGRAIDGEDVSWPVLGVEDEGDVRRVSVGNECISADLITRDPDPVVPDRGGAGGMVAGIGDLGRKPGPAAPWTVPQGAAILWSDGSEAGYVRRKHDRRQSGTQRGELQCFPWRNGIDLCHKRSELRGAPAEAATGSP
jgi:hypothetical protein